MALIVLVVLAAVFLVLGFVGALSLVVAVAIAVACLLAAIILRSGAIRL